MHTARPTSPTVLLALALGLCPAAPAAPTLVPSASAPIHDARSVIGTCVDQVVTTMQDDTLELEEKRTRVETVVDDRLDMASLAKYSLGSEYKKFDADQFAAFQESFREHLVNTYWNQAEGAELVSVDITSDREERRGDWTVKTKVVTATDDLTVDYRLRKQKTDAGERWLIIDIIIERVSLVQNFRSQFKELLAKKSPDELVEMLREKNTTARELRTG